MLSLYAQYKYHVLFILGYFDNFSGTAKHMKDIYREEKHP